MKKQTVYGQLHETNETNYLRTSQIWGTCSCFTLYFVNFVHLSNVERSNPFISVQPSHLEELGWLQPITENDMHSCSTSKGSKWLKKGNLIRKESSSSSTFNPSCSCVWTKRGSVIIGATVHRMTSQISRIIFIKTRMQSIKTTASSK